MRTNLLLTKALAVVALLLGGVSSVWADKTYTTVYSNDYETSSTISDIKSGDYKDCQIADGTNHYLKIRENGRNGGSASMTFPTYSSYDEYILSFKVGFYTSNNKASSFQLRSGSTTLATFGWGAWSDAGATISYTIGSTVQSETLTATKQSSGTRASDTNNSIAKWYTFTISGNKTDNKVYLNVNDGSTDVISNSVISDNFVNVTSFYFNLGNAHAEIGFDDLLLQGYSDLEIMSAPSIEITGVNGTDREVTITNGTSSQNNAVTTYYTTDGNDPTSASTVYTTPITISSDCTVKAITISSTNKQSDITSLAVETGYITLNAPTVIASDFTNPDGLSVNNPTFNFSCDNSGILGKPTANISYTFTSEGGSESSVTVGTSFTPTTIGTLKVIASADGYASSEKSFVVSNFYPISYIGRDYSIATPSDITTTWGSGYDVTWSGWAEGLTAYLSTAETKDDNHLNIQNYNTISLVNGWGLVRGDQKAYNYRVRYAKDGEFIAFKENTSKGSDAIATTYQTAYCSSGTGLITDLVTISVPASYTVQQLYQYSPSPVSVSATVGANGFTTFASSYPLDLANLPEGLKAYTATLSGTTLAFAECTQAVPAGTGLLLEGTANVTYDIPVVSALSKVGNNALTGVIEENTPLKSDDTNYIFAMKKATSAGDPLSFAPLTSESEVNFPAGKAYIEVPASAFESTARALVLTFDDATSVKELKNSRIEELKSYYNLNGQRVSQPSKGLYIVNGKKVVIK